MHKKQEEQQNNKQLTSNYNNNNNNNNSSSSNSNNNNNNKINKNCFTSTKLAGDQKSSLQSGASKRKGRMRIRRRIQFSTVGEERGAVQHQIHDQTNSKTGIVPFPYKHKLSRYTFSWIGHLQIFAKIKFHG